MLNPCAVASAAVRHVEGSQGEALLQISQWNELGGPLKHKSVSLIINHRDVTLPAVSPPRCKAAWWTHGTWSPYYGNSCRRIPSPSDHEWHPGRPEIWGGRRGKKKRGELGAEVTKYTEKMKRNEAQSKETAEVNGGEEDRGEANRAAASGVEHQSVPSERPVNSRSSITERTPRALLLPTPSQCQEHRKYQDTLNRLFQGFVL